MADLSSILGGMVQGFKDFGTGLVDFFGTGAANIGDIASSIATGRATTKNQDDFRKWLYQTDDTQDAAAKGLGTILNGVSTVADVMPGAQAVTANPLFNGLQGAIGGVSDELKMAGKDADFLVFDNDLLTAAHESFSHNMPSEVYIGGKKMK